MSKVSYAFLAAGGTGGHINAALSLGNNLEKRGIQVTYLSGKRHLDYKLYKDKNVLHLNARPLLGRNSLGLAISLLLNFIVFLQSIFLFLKKRPVFVFGAGGYICGPTLLSAKLLGIPVFILEQNSVMGLTNKLLSKISDIVFLNFDKTIGCPENMVTKVYGNPVSHKFIETNWHKIQSNPFRVLVFGGSLGALEINNMIKKLLEHYDLDFPIQITHQVGKGKAVDIQNGHQVTYTQLEYIDDMAKEIYDSDLVICRGGASSITELMIAKRACIIIPLTLHRDQHQVHNAKALEQKVGSPVHIENIVDLIDENCEKLKKIIQNEYLRDKSNDKDWHNIKHKNPSDLIIGEILSYVSK